MTATDIRHEDTFDPRSVPPFPTVHVRVTADSKTGITRGEVDGERVAVDNADPIQSVMDAAAAIAAKRPMKAVRVSATDTHDTTWLMVVHADGRTWDLDTNGPGEKKSTNATGMSNRALAMAVAGTLTLAAAGLGAAWWVSAHRDAGPPPTPTAAPPGESPVVPVQGWARRAAWVSPPLSDQNLDRNDGSPLAVTDRAIVTGLDTKDGSKLAGLRPSDGATLWEAPLPRSIQSPPQATSYNGREAIAAATDHKLYVWPNNGAPGSPPRATEWDFTEAGVKLVPNTETPVLANESTSTALVLDDGRLQKRVVPAEAQVIGADDQGRVTAVSDTGHWWRLTDKQTAPSPTMLRPPHFGAEVEDVLGVAGRTLVVAWSHGKDKTTVAGYATESSMEPTWDVPVEDQPDSNSFAASPNGSWFTAGATAIHSETGRAERLPEDWKTIGITDKAAWSNQHVATKLSPAKKMRESAMTDESVPVATTKDGHGLIITAASNKPRIYALEPDPGRSYDAGEPVPSPTKEEKAKSNKPNKSKSGSTSSSDVEKKSEKSKKDSAERKKSTTKPKGEK